MPVSTCIRATILILAASSLLLTACGGSDTGLSDRLLVIRNEGLAELDLATNIEQLLIETPEESRLIEPALSPDGTTISYVRQLIPIVIPGKPAEFGMDIYMADRDGGNQRLVIEHGEPNEQIRAPVWFPDGERLLMNVQRIIGGRILTSIEVFTAATGERSVVIEDGFRPALSADGTRIVYVTQDENILQTLWVANSDGSDPISLAGPDDGLGSFISPRFSPSGETIAFAGSNLPFESISRFSDETFVTLMAGARSSRPSGLAYNGLPADIWTIPAGGGEPRNLAPLQLDLPSIDWSADGARLFAYAGLGLFVVDPVDGATSRLGEGTFHGQMEWVGADKPE